MSAFGAVTDTPLDMLKRPIDDGHPPRRCAAIIASSARTTQCPWRGEQQYVETTKSGPDPEKNLGSMTGRSSKSACTGTRDDETRRQDRVSASQGEVTVRRTKSPADSIVRARPCGCTLWLTRGDFLT
jgi:hypothetical protein